MKIVVVSDTHMPRIAKKLPERLILELQSADAIIHAGDWTNVSVYEALKAYAPTYGVAGNNDGPDLVRKFGLKKKLELEGVRIGVVHGHGAGKRTDTEARAREAFKGTRLDILIFGHSHIPLLKQVGSLLVLNPGSPTDKRKQPLYSFAVLQLNEGDIQPDMIYYDNKG